ncbi:MAG TPA: hypothetical protein ENJ76_02725 [Oceanithermus sp.]|nr:hypothetical protein [Oceanithermus sp.]
MQGLGPGLLVAVAAGLLAHHLRVPGGAVVGAMVGGALYNFSGAPRAELPGWAGVSIQLLVGAMIGFSARRELLPVLLRVLPVALLGVATFLLVGALLSFLVVRLGWLDAVSALFGFVPGGISVMSVVAEGEGGKGAVVAAMHFVRVVTILLVAPWLARYLIALSRAGPGA